MRRSGEPAHWLTAEEFDDESPERLGPWCSGPGRGQTVLPQWSRFGWRGEQV